MSTELPQPESQMPAGNGTRGPDRSRKASTVATELIRKAILNGDLEPGRRLKEEQLAQDLGISRTPVREALLVLDAEGLIVAEPNRGATVRAYDAHDLEEIYELRALLEGYAAKRAAALIDDDELEVLEQSSQRFVALEAGEEHVSELVEENLLFHGTILDAARSERLAFMTRKAIELPLVHKSYHWYSKEQKQSSEHYHRQIVKALRTRDGELAELLMKAHVLEARDFLISQVADEPAEDE